MARKIRGSNQSSQNGVASPNQISGGEVIEADASLGNFATPAPTPNANGENVNGPEADPQGHSTEVAPSLVTVESEPSLAAKERRKQSAAKWRAKKKALESGGSVSSSDEDAQTANTAVMLISGLGVVLAGPEAAILPDERGLIAEPLTRMIGRLPEHQKQVVTQYSDPLMFLTGLSVWAYRVYQLAQAKQQAERETVTLTHEEEAPKPAPVPVYENGADEGEPIYRSSELVERMTI